jgi:hypothetical protein
MSTKSREVIYGGRIIGAKIRAEGAREAAKKAVREADRAAAELWSIQMEAFGGPAQPSPTIGQCLNGDYGWLQVKCHRCESEASIPLDAIRRPRDTPILETRGRAEMPIVQERPIRAARAYDQADGIAPDYAVSVGAS